ncbi:PdaC/SigV domain-containing protein [Aurantibacter sp.]|uniref:PdaC/SigV domain-containing protein n=1 Tax=Aurantibacter sp. TaxID=2807103 RepID=UPI0035C7A124
MLYRFKLLQNVFLISFLSFVLCSCKKDRVLEVSDYEYKNDKTALIEVNIQTVTGKSDTANNINQELYSFVCKGFYIDASKEIQNTIEDCANQFNDSYSNFKTQFSNELFQELPKWEAFVDGELMHQSELLLSFAMSSSINTGGSKPITKITFLNFDKATGQQLSFNNLVSNKTELLNTLKPYLEQELFSSSFKIEEFISKSTLKTPDHFGYNDLGIVALYETSNNDYIEVSVPFNKVEDYLNY